MMRDVLVASIHRGQFPPALIGLSVLAIILKMPTTDISKLLFHFLGLLERHEIFGYVLAALCGTGWFLHARLQRRWIGDELRRLSSERAQVTAIVAGTRKRREEVQT